MKKFSMRDRESDQMDDLELHGADETTDRGADGDRKSIWIKPGLVAAVVWALAVGLLLGLLVAGGGVGGVSAQKLPPVDANKWLQQPENVVAATTIPGSDSERDEMASVDSTGTGGTDLSMVVDVVDGTASGEVKKGVPVIRSLTDAGLSAGDAQLVINALDGIFDFRRAQPGQRFELSFDTENRPTRFVYHASLTDIYEVVRKGEQYKGARIEVKTDKRVRIFAGTITSSLFGTMKDLGAQASLASNVADILSTQVNFLKEQRPGDTFRVMVEEERLDGVFLSYGPVMALEYIGVKAGKRRLFRFKARGGRETYYDDNLVSIPSTALAIPLYYSRLSSPFGWRMHPVLHRKKLHNGVDFSAPRGTPVWACADGTVVFAARKGPNGNLISIAHDNGLTSHYAHLTRFASGIKKGVKVKRKQLIGYVGSTGRSTGPHLHWGLKLNGKFIDPLKYKVIPGRRVPARDRPALKALIARLGAQLAKTPIAPPKGALAVVPEGDEPLGDY